MGVKEDLEARIGEVTGVGEWHTVTQADIDKFADATRDHQWIHVDAERASRGPFGSTIAHGFMTLALIPGIGPRLEVTGVAMIINYGLERVRFVSPVPAGSRVRVVSEMAAVSETAKGVRVNERVTVELEGSDRPACVAETVILLVP
jgi:acyl dehydratase